MDADNPCTLEERYTRATTGSSLRLAKATAWAVVAGKG